MADVTGSLSADLGGATSSIDGAFDVHIGTLSLSLSAGDFTSSVVVGPQSRTGTMTALLGD